MTKRKRNRIKLSYTRSYYRLTEIIQKINSGQVLIKKNAIDDAYKQFGWGLSDIKNAYRILKPKHFHKTDISKYITGVAVDAYKVTVNGERIYTHFYVNKSGFLVINSFHEQ